MSRPIRLDGRAGLRKTTKEREVPEAIQSLAIKRTRGFAEFALAKSQIGLNFFEVLMVSCYVQGVEDTVQIMGKRTEGKYEEER